jgi:transketolase
MNALAKRLPNFLGGSADLAPSTKTRLIGYGDLGFAQACSRNIHFGVREHAMGAIINGMALHGGLIPYAATFFTFSDYLRPTLRLAALMNLHSIFVFTHDSIGLGEDGPTHQPVEHLASLRAIPNFAVIRPADANETAAAWRIAITRRKPAALILARQKTPVLDIARFPISEGVVRGAYILAESKGQPEMILIASGSEVHLALAAQEVLSTQGYQVRVVSMPCWEIFSEQSEEYRNQVLPPEVTARLAIEAGSSLGWRRWVGGGGAVIAVDRFGASAPGPVVLEHYGFTVDNVVAQVLTLLKEAEKCRLP